jgi:hypothetical protein
LTPWFISLILKDNKQEAEMNLRTSLDTLGISPDTDAAQAKRAYKLKVRRWHPDQFPEGSTTKARAEEQLKQINVAYARVSAYLALKRPQPTVTATTGPYHPGRGGAYRHDPPGVETKKRSWVNHLFDTLNAYVGDRAGKPYEPADDVTASNRRKTFGQVLDEMAVGSISPKQKRQTSNPAAARRRAASDNRLYHRNRATVGKVGGAESPGPVKPVGRVRGIGRSR